MSVEKFDDVAFVSGGQPIALVKTKHRVPGNFPVLDVTAVGNRSSVWRGK